MADHRVSSLSLEYVTVPVEAEKLGEQYDPTLDVVQMAFTAVGSDPVPGDWKAAIWETEEQPPIVRYRASCLVGPGGAAVLSKGVYAVWVKIADNPESPIMRAGTLQVY